MKKTILFMALSALFTMQTQAQMKWGVKAGYNASSISGMEDVISSAQGSIPVYDYSTSYRSGFHGGVVMQYDFPFTRFFLQSELLYSLQGVKEEYVTTTSSAAIPPALGLEELPRVHNEETNQLSYLQLPVYGGYKFDLGLGLDLLVAVGPYFAYGLSGSDNAFDNFKRFDFGLSGMAGVQFSRFQLTAGYDLGLVDIMDANGWKTMKDIMGLSSISNRNAKISLVCFF